MKDYEPNKVDGFGWVKKTSKFNEVSIQNHSEDSNIGYFLKLILKKTTNYQKG